MAPASPERCGRLPLHLLANWNYVVPQTSCKGLLTDVVPSVLTLSDPKSPSGSLLLQKLLLRRMAGKSRRPWRRELVARMTRQK